MFGSLVAFVPAALALILAPGPDTAVVLGAGLDGRRPGLATAAGVATGILVHTAAVVVGIALLLRTVPVLYDAVRVLGGVYLVFLGGRMLWDADGITAVRGETAPYRRGLLVNVLNPKVALFFLAFLPQFATADREVALLGGTYAVLTLGYLSLVALAAERLAPRLERHGGTFGRLVGLVVLGFGVVTLLA